MCMFVRDSGRMICICLCETVGECVCVCVCCVCVTSCVLKHVGGCKRNKKHKLVCRFKGIQMST